MSALLDDLWLTVSNNIRGNRARKLGWTPKYDVEHLYNTAAADAATIATNIKARQS